MEIAIAFFGITEQIAASNVPQNWIKSSFVATKSLKERLRQFIEAYHAPPSTNRTNQATQSQQSQRTGTQQPSSTNVSQPDEGNDPNSHNITQSPSVRRSPRRNKGRRRAQPPPPSTAERAQRRDALKNASNSSLRGSSRNSRTRQNTNLPSTQERARGRATLMTAPQVGPSPGDNAQANNGVDNGDDDNNNTPINQLTTRLFGSTSTAASTRQTSAAASTRQTSVTTRQQQRNTNVGNLDEDSGSSSDEDHQGGFELELNESAARPQNPLDENDYDEDNDVTDHDEHNGVSDSDSDDEDPNNTTNLKVLIDNLHFHYKSIDASDNGLLDWKGTSQQKYV